jgi:UDP-3-O-[3-hydroxymyristoyl] glucosamine N-acyltransferase
MTTKEIAEFLSAELVGDPAIAITGIASLGSATTGDLCFAEKAPIPATDGAAVIVPDSFTGPTEKTVLKVKDPKLAFSKIGRQLHAATPQTGWAESVSLQSPDNINASYLGPNVSIGDNCVIEDHVQIHAGVRIGNKVKIGKDTIIYPNCVIYDGAKLGNGCVIHAGTVIGSDGFGYVKDENGEHVQFPQVGSVVIGDNVEIGANCTIDRGSLGVTEIGDGTKIDNLVHIAHNVKIGKRVLIAGQSGIAGSTVIEDDVVIAGQVGISDHVTIKSGAIIGAKSSVFPHKVLPSGFWMGIPVEPLREYRKRIARSRRGSKKD